MDFNSPYIIILLLSGIIILSYLFNIIARNLKVPSILLLIGLGAAIRPMVSLFGIDQSEIFNILELLGIIGLIMIVLEAALDLKINRETKPIMIKALAAALISLLATTSAFSALIYYYFETSLTQAMYYALPLSIISSAIVIPSVADLDHFRKEFLIYESALSDIFGIIGFYAIEISTHTDNAWDLTTQLTGTLLTTILLSTVSSLVLILIFQRIKTNVKLFLLIAMLMALYAIGKLFHLSSLIIILVFGLLLNNIQLVARGWFKRFFHFEALNKMLDDFRLLTAETAFVVRTFFFVVFGVTIVWSGLMDTTVLLIGGTMVLIMFVLRSVALKASKVKIDKKVLFIAPRGLISILLFYAIPADYQISNFTSSIVLSVVLGSSLIMWYALSSKDKQNGLYDDLMDESIMAEEEDIVVEKNEENTDNS